MKLLQIVILAMLVSHSLTAQKSLRVYKGAHHKLMTNVTVQPGFTVYTLTKALGISPSDFIASNPGLSTIALELNTAISLPIHPGVIKSDPLHMINPLKLIYVVKPQETLYSLARVYTHQDVQTIMNINDKTDNTIYVNESIILGYIDWPYANADPTIALEESYPLLGTLAIVEESTPQAQITRVSEREVVQPSEGSNPEILTGGDTSEAIRLADNIHVSKGIAYCDPRDNTSKEMLVMHPSAKIDSKIELYNPMLNRTVLATVVGHLPENYYAEDIRVVISPSVAEALGALDERFLVEMTYIEE